jgi:hypothetical protein
LWRAERIGLPVGVLCRQIHRRDGETDVRRILTKRSSKPHRN